MSGCSTETASLPDSITAGASAATDSIQNSRSYAEITDDNVTEMSEPPDGPAAWAVTSSEGNSTEGPLADDEYPDHLDLSFMLERPFDGLETILEEEECDNEGAASHRLPRSFSSTSFQVCRRSGGRHSGPVGDPVFFSSSLSSPELVSSELVRTSPCSEANGSLKPQASGSLELT
jgi:hypothetical protein